MIFALVLSIVIVAAFAIYYMIIMIGFFCDDYIDKQSFHKDLVPFYRLYRIFKEKYERLT